MRAGPPIVLLAALLVVACDRTDGTVPTAPASAQPDVSATVSTDGDPDDGTHDGEAAAEERPTSAEATSPEVASPEAPRRWLDTRGTSLIGFGILRLIPAPGGRSRFRIHYEEEAGTYSTTDNLQLFVLPADSFARSEMAYANQFLAFTRTVPSAASGNDGGRGGGGDDGYGSAGYGGERLSCQVEVTADAECTLLVGYGPWTGPDTGRPPGDTPTFRLEVTPLADPSGAVGAHEWVESEAGELITTNWTGRPGVRRGEPCFDPIGREDIWIEIRPLILYDARLARAADEPPDADLPGMPEVHALEEEAQRLEAAGDIALATDRRDRAADLLAAAARRDRRVVLTPRLTEKFRRVPIRWR